MSAKPTPPKPRIISPADLKPGQQIVAFGDFVDPITGDWHLRPVRGVKVNTVEPCKGNWRTHTHVNGLGCYDNRVPVEVQ